VVDKLGGVAADFMIKSVAESPNLSYIYRVCGAISSPDKPEFVDGKVKGSAPDAF
jgi:hypothetical protein